MSAADAAAYAQGLSGYEGRYAEMVYAHRTGARKSLAAPKGFAGLDSDRAAEIREEIDREMIRGESVTVAPSPIYEPLDDPKGEPSRFSVTLLSRASDCLLMAHLERQHRAQSVRMIRGSLLHQVTRILTIEALRDGRTGYTEEEAADRAGYVMENPDEGGPIALDTYFNVIEMAKRWSRKAEFWPDAIPHVEELFTRIVQVDGVDAEVSARIDLVQVREGEARIDDYKTGPRVPTQAEFERHIQTPMYAWVIAPIYQSVHTYDVGEVYVSEMLDTPIRRSAVLAPEDIGITRFVENSVRALRRAYEKEEFTAVAGSHCELCALPSHCPFPSELRPDAAIEDAGHASDALAWMLATQAQMEKVRRGLRGYVARSGEVIYSGDMRATLKSRVRNVPDSTVIETALLAEGIDPQTAYKTSEFVEFSIERVRDE